MKRKEWIYESININFSGFLGMYVEQQSGEIRKFRSNKIFIDKALEEYYKNYSKKNKNIGDIFVQDLTEKKGKIDKYIKDSMNLQNKRYLLIFFENNFCKDIIKNNIRNILGDKRKMVHLKGSQLIYDLTSQTYPLEFLKGLKIYIKYGYTVLLENLDSIYTLLYDLFNKNYYRENQKNYCRISTEDKQDIIEIHDNFRCILLKPIEQITNSKNIEIRLPSPLLNRLEKHIVKFDDLNTKMLKNVHLLIIVLTNAKRNHENMLTMLKDEADFRVTINDLIFCYNNTELVQSLLLEIQKENRELSNEEFEEKIKMKIVRFYSFKMVVLHCLNLKGYDEEIQKIKSEYQRTHPYSNLKNFLKKNKKGGNEIEIKKFVIMTSTYYFSVNFDLLRG